MTTISGNNYTYVGTDLANALGYLITRIPTANSSDTLPIASDIILSFVGVNSATNNGQSFHVSIFNNSSFTITLNTATGVTFTGISSDSILPQVTRTYTFVQTAVSTVSCYIIGEAPNVPSTNSGIPLANNHILVGNSSNVATDVAMSNDASISNTGALTLSTVNSNVGSFSAANITVNAKGLITAASAGVAGSNTQIQFNNSGVLGASSDLTWDGTSLSTIQLISTATTGNPPFIVASTTQVSNLNAATAGSATNVGITDDTTTNATMYPTWVTGTSGSLPEKVSSTKLRFNPSTSTITLGTANTNSQIVTTNASVATNTGGHLIVQTGTGNTTGQGGNISELAGQGGDTGAGGNLIYTAGAGGSTSGLGGNISLTAGAGTAGNSAGGVITVAGGAGQGSASGGQNNLNAGAGGATGSGGLLQLKGGNGGSTSGNAGGITLLGGTPVAGNGGTITISASNAVGGTNTTGGNLVVSSGNSTGTGTGGSFTLTSGTSGSGATGNGGDITVTTGAATSTNGSAGVLTLTTGSSTGSGTSQTNVGSTSTAGSYDLNLGSSTTSNVQSTAMTWTGSSIDTSRNWPNIVWGNGQYVAVANTGVAAGMINTSPDGITWTPRTSTSTNNWSGLCWAPDIQRYLAVSSGAVANTNCMFSNDGITWTQTTTMPALTFNSVCRGTSVPGSLGNVFVTASANGNTTITQIYTSPDGVTWTARTVPAAANPSWRTCCWANGLQLFVVVAAGGASAALQIITSPDGVTWTARSSSSLQSWSSVCYSPDLNLLVAVAGNGTAAQQIMTSRDGITWTAATSSSVQGWSWVCWSGCFKMFVALTGNGSTMYSATGTGTWTAGPTLSGGTNWTKMCFSDTDYTLKRFVAVALTGSPKAAYTSSSFSTYNNILDLGTVGTSTINLSGSNVVCYPTPYYYGENTFARSVVLNTPLTDITINNVPNGTYLVRIWMLNLLKTGAATTDFIIMTGSVQGTIYSFTATPALSLVGSASAAGASTGPKFFQFRIFSNSTTGFQNISYQYQSTASASIFTAGALRNMYLQRIG